MKATIATLFASLAAAQLHAPVGEPKGNAITRPLNEVVPACKQFTITWQPTTPNTVSVLLLKGPSNNVVKFGPALAEGIANSGSLAWTPTGDLPTTDGPNGYGIQIIDDVTGQYQYSTQFGISKGENCAPVVSSSGYATSSYHPTASVSASVTGGYGTANSTSVHKSTTIVYSTASHNGTTSKPTSGAPSSTVVRSTSGSATTSSVPQQTVNAGSALQAGLGLAGAAAAAILML